MRFDHRLDVQLSHLTEDPLEILYRLSHRLFHGSFDKQPIEETRRPGRGSNSTTRRYRQPAVVAWKWRSWRTSGNPRCRLTYVTRASFWNSFSSIFKARSRWRRLITTVALSPGLLHLADRGMVNTNEIRPIRRPIFHVGDIGKCFSNGDREGVTHFYTDHRNLLVSYCSCWSLVRRPTTGVRGVTRAERALARGYRVPWHAYGAMVGAVYLGRRSIHAQMAGRGGATQLKNSTD